MKVKNLESLWKSVFPPRPLQASCSVPTTCVVPSALCIGVGQRRGTPIPATVSKGFWLTLAFKGISPWCGSVQMECLLPMIAAPSSFTSGRWCLKSLSTRLEEKVALPCIWTLSCQAPGLPFLQSCLCLKACFGNALEGSFQ